MPGPLSRIDSVTSLFAARARTSMRPTPSIACAALRKMLNTTCSSSPGARAPRRRAPRGIHLDVWPLELWRKSAVAASTASSIASGAGGSPPTRE